MARPTLHIRKRIGGSIRALATVLILSFLPSSSYAACSALGTEGLVGHWKLDETSGTVVDSAGSNDGTATNTPTYNVTGQVDAGMQFDGVSDEHVLITDPAGGDLDFGTTDFSYGGWFYPEAFPELYTIPFYKGGSSAGTDGYDIEFSRPAQNDTADACLADGATSVCTAFMASAPSLNTWHHLFVTVDRTADLVKTYHNGIYYTSGDTSGLVDISTANDLQIGVGTGGTSYDFQGTADDVRIYDRTLSATEVAGIYNQRSNAAGVAGEMIYNATNANLVYCNDTDWVHAGTGSYNPTAVHFEDSDPDYLKLNTATGPSSTTQWSGSFWVKLDTLGSYDIIFDSRTGTNTLDVNLDVLNDGRIQFLATNTADTTVLNLHSSALADTNWHHVMWSFDLSNTAKRHVYIDGATAINTVTTYNTAETMDFSGAIWTIGAYAAGSLPIDADLADFWIDFGSYIDLSIEENRQRFVSASGMPKYLGQDGSIPTGSAPYIFLTGDTANWHTNKGTGGGFTENGALTTPSSQPGDSLIQSGDLASGLVGHWKLDETSGTTATDSSAGGNNGTMAGGLDAGTDSAAGKVSTALDFDGTDDYVETAADAAYSLTSMTLAAWVYIPSTLPAGFATILEHDRGGNNMFALAKRPSGDNHDFNFQWAGWGGNPSLRSTTAATTDTWIHVVGTFDYATADAHFYINGVLESTDLNGKLPIVGSNFDIRIGRTNNDIEPWKGRIDDVRIYDRALSAADVDNLYRNGVPGKLQYNTEFNVMEYFNGAEWVAMGPTGGTPPTTNLVGHWKLDETSGTTATDSSAGGNNGTMAGGLDAGTDSAAGKVSTALDFDGTDDRITHGLALPKTEGTIAHWVRPAQIRDMVAYYEADCITSDCDGKGSAMSNLEIHTGISSNKAYLVYQDGAPAAQIKVENLGPNLTAGEWVHMAATWDTSGNAHLYLNGARLGSQDMSALTFAGLTQSVTQLGRVGDGQTNRHWDGEMDDVRVYSRALSAQEISQLYYYGLSGGVGDVSNTCTNAGSITGSTAEGIMFYNIDEDVMQYCNGEEWIGIGQ